MAAYLSTFRPLCLTAGGRAAIERYGHPPSIDLSCRREPDFESRFPSISALCHGHLFALRLKEGDRVIFMTVKSRYPGDSHRGWRLVAVLEVRRRFETHAKAAKWYSAQGLPLPSNCLVRGNDPLPLDRTGYPRRELRDWDLRYWKRTRSHGAFLVCEARFLELYTPPAIDEPDLVRIFSRVPATRNPPRIQEEHFAKLLALATEDEHARLANSTNGSLPRTDPTRGCPRVGSASASSPNGVDPDPSHGRGPTK